MGTLRLTLTCLHISKETLIQFVVEFVFNDIVSLVAKYCVPAVSLILLIQQGHSIGFTYLCTCIGIYIHTQEPHLPQLTRKGPKL